MSREGILVPLLESADESPAVRALLRTGASDAGVDYDFAGGLSEHLAALAGPAGAATAATNAAGGGALSAKALALAIGLPVASATVIAALWLSGTPEAPGAAPREVPSLPAVAPEVVPPALGVEPIATPAPASDLARPRRTRVQLRPQAAAATETPQRLTLEEALEGSPPPAKQMRGTPGEVPRSDPLRETQGAAAPESPVETEAEASARAEAARERRERAAERLELEMRELMEARRALAAEPHRALELARRGERQFPDSVLRQERRHVLILALLGLGKHDEARSLAAPYLARHPDSPFSARVKAALESRAPAQRR